MDVLSRWDGKSSSNWAHNSDRIHESGRTRRSWFENFHVAVQPVRKFQSCEVNLKFLITFLLGSENKVPIKLKVYESADHVTFNITEKFDSEKQTKFLIHGWKNKWIFTPRKTLEFSRDKFFFFLIFIAVSRAIWCKWWKILFWMMWMMQIS